jgi:Rad3-related DNA helicase
LHKDRLGQRWYEMSALQQVIQASGRIMRSETDWGDTYVLDRNAMILIKKYRNGCPDWFLGRIVRLRCWMGRDGKVNEKDS